jgi:hypothetical protein
MRVARARVEFDRTVRARAGVCGLAPTQSGTLFFGRTGARALQ